MSDRGRSATAVGARPPASPADRDRATRGAAAAEPDASEAAVYDVKFAIRCIDPVVGQSARDLFLIGSASMRDQNEIHLIEFHEERNDVSCERVVMFDGEVCDISCHPSSVNKYVVVGNRGGRFDTQLWQSDGLFEDLATSMVAEATSIAALPADIAARPLGTQWHPDGASLLAAYQDGVRMFSVDVGAGGSFAPAGSVLLSGPASTLQAAAVDPHSKGVVAMACDSDLVLGDARAGKVTQKRESAHVGLVRDVQFNPMKKGTLATVGDDGYLRLWDARKLTAPLRELGTHQHWAWCVRYNTMHDQFLLTTSTDTLVKLWLAVSASSSRVGGLDESAGGERNDRLIASFAEHEDSVYCAAWTPNASHPYVFATCSYDGRVLVRHVPRSEKLRVWL